MLTSAINGGAVSPMARRRLLPTGEPVGGPTGGPSDDPSGLAGVDGAPEGGLMGRIRALAAQRSAGRIQPLAGAAPGAQQPQSTTMPAMPAGDASAITELPDGQGGAVAVPPASVAGAAAPAAAPTPAPAAPPMPWEPGTFDADHNAINSVIEPGPGDPSRIDLASQYFDQLGVSADRQFGRDMTDATNAAASHGQIGSGMLTNRYGDLTEKLHEDTELARRGLATDAAAGTIGDNRSNRAEQRTERGYQSDLAQQALLRRIQQQQAEQQAEAQDFGQAATVYGLGNAGNPTNAYLDAAGQASNEAAGGYSAIQQLLAAIMARRPAA